MPPAQPPSSPSPSSPPPASSTTPDPVRRLSVLNRGLPVWILAAMAGGVLLGRLVPGLRDALGVVDVGGVSLPLLVGMLVMMYPPLAGVRYDRTAAVAADTRLMVTSVVLNWIIGPAVMVALGWLFLPDQPDLRTGLILVGLARCIAMVLVWNDLACGDRDAAAVLVTVNAVFQVVMLGVLGWFYLTVLPGWLGLPVTSAGFPVGDVVRSVLIFLGIPLVAGALSRVLGERWRGRRWYEQRYLPRVGPLALVGLLFTIVLLFCLQGDRIVAEPLSVVRVAVPLVVYFAVMFTVALLVSRAVGLGYARSTTVAFTAAGNNFELAIAVAVGTWGAVSDQALAGTVGPLVEVPVLVALVYVMLWAGPRLFPRDPGVPTGR
ncbi:ACR3 family arsenite transporter [Corynebacterium bovis DSM 20582 = CIP 54.80]|uniref:ACR3 family arsenite transporter n=2 Tax=Corynebacterium bovis TaxID=36808 RepID=A0A8H9Y5Q2_9CORY|nr:ACR3 family arsenite transporter [Corynebacterium bovis DSM 20582 = CIP 54.80]